MSRNLLAAETSPYLLQHKDNPVHWRPWGQAALAEATNANKPMLVSVGYAACHWCHVMAHESFEDSETAALMNDLYVCVKVDREERPDLDQKFQLALNALGQQGGWPLTIFLTPAGEPFWGGTYFPKDARDGRPAFKNVLSEIARLVQTNSNAVIQNKELIAELFHRTWNESRAGGLAPQMLNHSAVRLGQRFDTFFGGFTGTPKFPNIPVVELLWRAFLRTGVAQFQQLTAVTVDFMCQGGIYDHLGGGFARYSVDDRWLVPHFEKMLYDNAQLVDLLTLLWQYGRSELYRKRVEETIGWLTREMFVEGGGFASSLDADSEGEEGKFYLWSEAEIDAALGGTFVQRFKDVYGVTRNGNYQGRNILNRLAALSLRSEADEAMLAKQREKLLAARNQRVRPGRDDKVLADWNGLAICALANAGAVFHRSEWTAAASRCFNFVCEKLGDGDRLFHSYREGKRQHMGFADDYALMARAALALWEMTGDNTALARAQAWTRVLDQHFWDPTFGGYCMTPDDGEATRVRIRTVLDGPTPTANGAMVGVLGRLHFITGRDEYRDRSNLLLQAFASELSSGVAQMATYLNGFEFIMDAVQVVIVGPLDDARTHTLVQTVLGRSLPNRLLSVVRPDDKLATNHPAYGMTMQGGQPTAYLCRKNTCSPPITSPVALSQALLPEQPQVPQPAARTAGQKRQREAAAPARRPAKRS